MRGSIVRRGKTWSVVHDLDRGANGKRHQRWLSGYRTKREAERALAEAIHQAEQGDYVSPSRLTVADFLRRWVRDYAEPNLAPTTVQQYHFLSEKHFIPALGHVLLHQLKPEALQAYLGRKLADGLKPATVRVHHLVLHKALATAMKWRLLSRNPADVVDIPRAPRREFQTFDAATMAAFLDSVAGTSYHPLFLFLLHTGTRRSEALGLRWADLDLAMGYATINRGLHQLRDGRFVFTEPKTKTSRRRIPLTPTTSVTLRDWWEEQTTNRLSLGLLALSDTDLVFAHPDGSPLTPGTVSQAWQRAVGKAGYPGIRLHDARHTHATLMLQQGVHPKVVQERLGHASIAMTLDTYSHVLPGIQEQAALRFEEGLKVQTLGVMEGHGFVRSG